MTTSILQQPIKAINYALNGDPIAKERYEKTLTMRREAYHSKKSEQTA